MAKLEKPVEIVDDNGIAWLWDGRMLYVKGVDTLPPYYRIEDVGYIAESMDAVFRVLVGGMYITIDKKD